MPPHRHISGHQAFALGVVLNLIFVIAEAAFGLLSGSLALLADAGHNLSDVLGIMLSWSASLLSRRRPTWQRTYGWRSSTILAALLNALILLGVVIAISWEAVQRFYAPGPVANIEVILVASAGVAVNTVTALLFFRDRKNDLNVRAAFMHMAADAGVSVGVASTGALMMITGWRWLDPLISLCIALIILVSTWGLLRESLAMTLHAVPAGIDTRAIEGYLSGLPGVTAVHDLHVWAMSTTETALTAHLVKPDPSRDDSMILQIQRALHERYGISHVTIQWERTDCSGKQGATACGVPSGDAKSRREALSG